MDTFESFEFFVDALDPLDISTFTPEAPLDSSPVDQERFNSGNYGAFCTIS